MNIAYETIRYDGPDADGIARITLHRPERLNAFTNRMQRELGTAFDRVDADPLVRAVVVTGSGRAFSRAPISAAASGRSRAASEAVEIPVASSSCASSTARSLSSRR